MEELRPHVFDRWYDQGAIEEIVVLLTRRFCNQQATVAGRAVQEAALMRIRWIVLRTDRIVGAKTP